MLTLPPGARVFLATSRVDGRKGINGLSALVRSQFFEDPLSGTLYVFFTKRADGVRVLQWDRDGYVLTTKRLELGQFRVPWKSETGHVTLEAAELLLVLEGIDLSRATRRPRWSPSSRGRAVSQEKTRCGNLPLEGGVEGSDGNGAQHGKAHRERFRDAGPGANSPFHP